MEPPSPSIDQLKKPTYKYCIVPKCGNTIRNAPDKVFFLVPRGADIREKWCKIMKRDMISPSSCLYCCEDHFDIENDTYNYMEYKIMKFKQKITLRLKKGILPHKFQCQKYTQLRPPTVRKSFLKRKHLEIIESALPAPPAEQSVDSDSSENYLETGTSLSSSHILIEEQLKKPTYKYCIVPKCRNTIRNAPDKVFFLVPRGADIRKKWCKIMKRDMISPSTCLYCCEDHFDIEEDTYNYMEYKIMKFQEKQKITLRLKKGILPHKFQCQKYTRSWPPTLRKGFLKRKHLEIIESALPATPAEQSVDSDSSSENYLEADTSLSPPYIYIEGKRKK